MLYAAIALAILGFAVGLAYRLKVLLPILAALLIGSVVFSVGQGFSFLNTALTIMVAQAVIQLSYFLGLVIRALFGGSRRMRPIL
jgi:hypothetical protein